MNVSNCMQRSWLTGLNVTYFCYYHDFRFWKTCIKVINLGKVWIWGISYLSYLSYRWHWKYFVPGWPSASMENYWKRCVKIRMCFIEMLFSCLLVQITYDDIKKTYGGSSSVHGHYSSSFARYISSSSSFNFFRFRCCFSGVLQCKCVLHYFTENLPGVPVFGDCPGLLVAVPMYWQLLIQFRYVPVF